jgi:aconitate hydratase
MNFLASPPLVVAYALAGSLHVNLLEDPLDIGSDGAPVYLRDLWPTEAEIAEVVDQYVQAEMFTNSYADVFTGDDQWRALPIPISMG